MIRQFVAMPLGSGYSVEEQLTGAAEHGGVQLLVRPMRKEAYRPIHQPRFSGYVMEDVVAYEAPLLDMGLSPGGQMCQEIYDDPHDFLRLGPPAPGPLLRSLANALVWRAITGEDPPTTPPTSEEYTRAGLPWFEYYAADQKALSGGARLKEIRRVVQAAKDKGDMPLPENEAVDPKRIVRLRAGLQPDEVRVGDF